MTVPMAYKWLDLNDFRTKSQPNVAQTGTVLRGNAPFVGWEAANDGGGGSGGSSNSTGAGVGKGGAGVAGTIGTGMGIVGSLTGNHDIGVMGGAIGAGAAATQGQYGPAGSMIGGVLSGSPVGALAGGLIGRAMSDAPITGKSIATSMMSAAVPGFGIANALTGGWATDTLFGKDISFNAKTNTVTEAQPGILGNWGKQSFGPDEQGNVENPGSKNAKNGSDLDSDQNPGGRSTDGGVVGSTGIDSGLGRGGEDGADRGGINGGDGGVSGGGPEGTSGGSEGNGHGGEGGNGGW